MNKKQKFILILLFIVTIIVAFFAINFVIDSNSLKKYNNGIISFKYDDSWNVSNYKNDIYLNNKTNGSITITLTELTEEDINMSIEETNSSVIYKLMENNENYKKINEVNMKLTSVYYDGYKTLLEDDNSQALIYVAITSDYILTVNFTAQNKYFDLTLDSVENIVGSIAI